MRYTVAVLLPAASSAFVLPQAPTRNQERSSTVLAASRQSLSTSPRISAPGVAPNNVPLPHKVGGSLSRVPAPATHQYVSPADRPVNNVLMPQDDPGLAPFAAMPKAYQAPETRYMMQEDDPKLPPFAAMPRGYYNNQQNSQAKLMMAEDDPHLPPYAAMPRVEQRPEVRYSSPEDSPHLPPYAAMPRGYPAGGEPRKTLMASDDPHLPPYAAMPRADGCLPFSAGYMQPLDYVTSVADRAALPQQQSHAGEPSASRNALPTSDANAATLPGQFVAEAPKEVAAVW